MRPRQLHLAPRRASLGAVIAFAVLLMLPGWALHGPLGSSSWVGPNANPAPLATPSGGPSSTFPGPARTASAPPSALNCSEIEAGWKVLYGGGPAPPAVAGTSEPGCVPGPDEEGVGLVSNASASGNRLEVSVGLPTASTSAPSSFDEFWLSMTVRGVSCSLDGQSVLRIDLAPPGSPLGVSGGWAVRSPVWGLDPAGACDPRCQNTTAYYDLGGNGYCLDNTLLKGVGSSGGPQPLFAPGDALRFTITDGGGQGLTVYANDTTRPILSTSWSYPSGSLVDGSSVEPFGSTATPTNGWTFGSSVGFGWTNCPWIDLGGAPSCDSYDASIDAALSFPIVTGSAYWNASASLYSNAFSGYETWSSTGACQGNASLPACLDYGSNGGTGFYPGIHLSAGGGTAWIGYGANTSSTVGVLGPSFAPDGSASGSDPAIVGDLSASINGTAIVLSARSSDPRGIGNVVFSALFCFAGGTSISPGALTYNGTPSAGVANGTGDAYWTALFPRGNNLTGGTLYYNVVEYPIGPGAGTLPVYARSMVPSSGLVCGAPTAPLMLALRAVAISQGYEVQWSYPAQDTAFVRNFSIVATPTSGPSVVLPVPVYPTPSGLRTAPITGLAAGAPYTVYVRSTQVDGRPGPTGPGGLSPLPTDSALNVTLAAASLERTQPGAADTFTASATGGSGPYSFRFELGNGSVEWVYGQPSTGVVTASFPGVLGLVRVEVTANDSVGDVSAPAFEYVLFEATPLGVTVSLSTGDDVVGLTWTPPTSPVARYVVFYSQSPTDLYEFTSFWPDNGTSAQPVLLWNTTGTAFNFSAINGERVYAEVIAFNAVGSGMAPSTGPATGVPTLFDLLGFGPSPGTAVGGAAPFTASLTSATSQGTLNNLSQAIYTVSELAPVSRPFYLSVPATPTSLSLGASTWGWANASLVFNATGTYLVQVHLEDFMGDPELIPSVDLYVGTGAPPTVSIAIAALSAIPFAGTPVDFTGSATGTPGPYNYSWQFGDGTAAFDAGPTPSHRYAIAGSYTAVLTVTDNETGGSASVAHVVEVNAYPIVRISASEGTGGDLSWYFQLIEIGGSGRPQVAWSFGDGTDGNGANASHTYANPGEYTVRVTISDPAGIPSVSSNLTIYAGVPRSTQSFAESAAAIGLILVLSIGLLVLAILTVLFYRRSRPPPRSLVPSPSTYLSDRSPPPRDTVE
ncbi:MAG TPA: PKD domain-containing protein [Thermoplasmata archaeon]|nr:PKD domain-containing protein [Thermoplasmata archaeon]